MSGDPPLVDERTISRSGKAAPDDYNGWEAVYGYPGGNLRLPREIMKAADNCPCADCNARRAKLLARPDAARAARAEP